MRLAIWNIKKDFNFKKILEKYIILILKINKRVKNENYVKIIWRRTNNCLREVMLHCTHYIL